MLSQYEELSFSDEKNCGQRTLLWSVVLRAPLAHTFEKTSRCCPSTKDYHFLTKKTVANEPFSDQSSWGRRLPILLRKPADAVPVRRIIIFWRKKLWPTNPSLISRLEGAACPYFWENQPMLSQYEGLSFSDEKNCGQRTLLWSVVLRAPLAHTFEKTSRCCPSTKDYHFLTKKTVANETFLWSVVLKAPLAHTFEKTSQRCPSTKDYHFLTKRTVANEPFSDQSSWGRRLPIFLRRPANAVPVRRIIIFWRKNSSQRTLLWSVVLRAPLAHTFEKTSQCYPSTRDYHFLTKKTVASEPFSDQSSWGRRLPILLRKPADAVPVRRIIIFWRKKL